MSALPHEPDGACCPYPALPPPVALPLVTPPSHACPYIPGRQATLRAFAINRLSPEIYHDFMDAGFRRAGKIIYQPVCRGCRACMPIRIPINDFQPNKSMRRCLRQNRDLLVSVAPPMLSEEKARLYSRYLSVRHDGTMEEDAQSLEGFLYDSPVETLEFSYRLPEGRLVGVGICDVSARSLSSVYFFFDPAEYRRGLGNFGALTEIDYARRRTIPYWYLGYWVKGSRPMEYKTTFRPHELLHPDGQWRAGGDGGNDS